MRAGPILITIAFLTTAKVNDVSAQSASFTTSNGRVLVFETIDDIAASSKRRLDRLSTIGDLDIVPLDAAEAHEVGTWPIVRFNGGPPLILTGEIGVEFASGINITEQHAILANQELTVRKNYNRDPPFAIVAAKVGSNPFTVAQNLINTGSVRFAEPVMLVPMKLHGISPNDTIYEQNVQLHLREDLHHIPSAWDTTTGANQVKIAVLDTGIDLSHPDLAANLLPGFGVIADPMDGSPEIGTGDDFHGTAVGGLIAAVTNNGQGVAGICWKCKLIPVFLIDAAATIYVDQSKIYDAFHEAINRDAWIIHNSWGPYGRNDKDECYETPFSDFVAKGVNEAKTEGRHGRGTLVVWSAGNDNCPTDLQPHLLNEDTLVVSALDGFANFQGYSNYGEHIDLSAVEGNWTTDISGQAGSSDGTDEFIGKIPEVVVGDYMRNFRGTSAAAPIATGALALMLSVNPNLTFEEAKSCIIETAAKHSGPCAFGDPDSDGFSPCYGHGLVDAAALVIAATSGECGGTCQKDEDCIPGTSCNIDSELCVFEGSSDSDADTDVDADTDADSEADSDVDSDGDSDTASDSSGQSDSEINTDTNSDSDQHLDNQNDTEAVPTDDVSNSSSSCTCSRIGEPGREQRSTTLNLVILARSIVR